MIWAMILAAGESRRMGRQKLLLPFKGKTIIETVIKKVICSKAEKILVVIGSEKENMEKKIREYPVKIAYNPDFRSGMLSSLQRGFKALPKSAEAVLIVLGDQPALSSAVINKIIDAYKRTKKGIVLPIYRGERGHPVLIDMKYRQEVARLDPDIGLRQLVYDQREDILEVKVTTPSILRDIDDERDYRKELKNK